ncbi:glyoxalase/bleomycin resistance protein/dioxygenase superfamily protein [Arthrobacter oryzae]|uniref:Glyoxalase/bleomycin resistance protein/dioxygenase superfamily protein n=1 Tax=Arthrobacter oryzae TaxID=409290 RepID=A0A495EUL9_9MICC|nr:glyoxalase/bleomycin resistance protein/dioxygenase superfamily protein [Arthrobacter oryzae]
MAADPVDPASLGSLHHVELWVPDLQRAQDQWGWLLGRLGYEAYQDWEHGCSWRRGPTYIVVEQSPALLGTVHQRTAPGLNHLAFSAGPGSRWTPCHARASAMAGANSFPRSTRMPAVPATLPPTS